MAGDRAGSLGMGFRGLAVKGSGVRIPSAPPERQPLKPLPRQGFRRAWRRLAGESGRVLAVESPRGIRERLQEDGAETLCGNLIGAFERVPVHVQSDGNRPVPRVELINSGCSPRAMNMAVCGCRGS